MVIENGVRKMHLFDFIQALTNCGDNVRNEWERVEKSLEKAIVTKITIAQKYQFPRLDGQLARADSMTIDIYQAAKVALSIGKRANWFNELLTTIGVRFIGGDLTLASDVEYMHIGQQLMRTTEPDNFLRLWGEEFFHGSTIAREQQETSNPEIILDAMAPTTVDVMEEADITVDTVAEECGRRRYRSRSKSQSRPRDRVGKLYAYKIIPVYQTREEVYKYVNRPIRRDLPLSVVISKADLDGLLLVKPGRTKYSVGTRSNNYVRPWCSELYQVDQASACEFVVEHGDLEDAERETLKKIRESNPEAEEKAGLLLDNGDLTWPSEVFRVKNVEAVHSQIREAIAEYQMGLPIDGIKDKHLEQIELKQIEAEKELKQIELETKVKIELESKRMEMEMNGKLELVRFLSSQGASIDQLTRAYYGVSSSV